MEPEKKERLLKAVLRVCLVILWIFILLPVLRLNLSNRVFSILVVLFGLTIAITIVLMVLISKNRKKVEGDKK